MATYDLTQAQFENSLEPNIDNATQRAILQYLEDHDTFGQPIGGGPLTTLLENLQAQGILPTTGPIGQLIDLLETLDGAHPGATVQISSVTGDQAFLDPQAQIAEFSSTHPFTVDTSGADSIEAIIGVGHGDTITLTGDHDVLFAASEGMDSLTDQSSSNNEVLGGAGSDTIVHSGSGSDSILGGAGGDSIDHSMGSGDDTIIGGQGADTILGGEGSDSIVGGAGADSIVTGTGDNQSIMAGAGNDTIEWSANSGTGDTIDGGGGHNTLLIDDHEQEDVAATETHGGTTTLRFNDGTTLTYEHVNIEFNHSGGGSDGGGKA